MPIAPTPISPYATPPSSDDSANFDARADAKVADDVAKVGEYNALAENVYDNAEEAAGSAIAALAARGGAEAAQAGAQAAAAAAGSSAGAAPWVSGNYNAGQAARSTVDYRIYVARTTGSKPTDPSADPTNWGLASANGLQLIPVTGTSASAFVGGRSVLKNAAKTTLTAPVTSTAGDEFAVKWVNGRYDNEIDFGGAKVEGVVTNLLTLNGSPRGAAHWVWIDSTTGWGAIV